MIESHAVSEALARLAEFSRSGEFRKAADYGSMLDESLRRDASVSLALARLRAKQGYIDHALSLLATAAQSPDRPALNATLQIEHVALTLFRTSDFGPAVEKSGHLLADARCAEPDSSLDLADASRVHARIIQMAYVYFEVDDAIAEQAQMQMLRDAELLLEGGRHEAAIAAYHNHADWPRSSEASKVANLKKVAERAAAIGLHSRAGEALLAIGELLVASGTAPEIVDATIAQARLEFEAAKDRGGQIGVDRLSLLLGFRNGTRNSADLGTLIEAYDAEDRPKDALSVLMDLSGAVHQDGDIGRAWTSRQQEIERAEKIGLTLACAGSELALADMLMRNKRLSDAIDICEAGLKRALPRFVKAQQHHMLGAAYGFAGDTRKAIAQYRMVLEFFEEIGALDSASLAATGIANQLLSLKHFTAASDLAATWTRRDIDRGDAESALRNKNLSIQAAWQRYAGAAPVDRQISDLDEAERLIAEAESLAARLPHRPRAQQRGGLAQVRATVRSLRGICGEPIAGFEEAVGIYESADLAMEAANTRYLLGICYLNASLDAVRAHQREQSVTSFGDAERKLGQALDYYDAAFMRLEAAKSRFMLARLFANMASGWGNDLASQLENAALEHLDRGFLDLDAVRRQYASGSTTDMQTGKLTFSEESVRLVELALEILVAKPDRWSEAWDWVQRGKSRSLSDLLGLFARPPARLTGAIEADAETTRLLAEQTDIASRLRVAPSEDRPGLRARLDDIDAKMQKSPTLAAYRDFTRGAPLAASQLASVFAADGGVSRRGVCVDWLAIGDALYLMTAEADEPPRIERLPIHLSAVKNFVEANLVDPRSRRQTLQDPSALEPLHNLVAPLAWLTRPEDLLVLSPTGPLHAIPLHALDLGGAPLLARNPVLYANSLGITHHAVQGRGTHQHEQKLIVFGDPSEDRSEAQKVAAEISSSFGAPLKLGSEASKNLLVAALATARYLHFQGHARFDWEDPLASHLVVAEPAHADAFAGRLTAREIMDRRDVRAELVSLGACESAASIVKEGDEPMGVVSALLVAGAGSVLAALWPVQQASCAAFMKAFYLRLLKASGPVAKADALRAAALEVARHDGFDTPYHWAAYVLHGDWF